MICLKKVKEECLFLTFHNVVHCYFNCESIIFYSNMHHLLAEQQD